MVNGDNNEGTGSSCQDIQMKPSFSGGRRRQWVACKKDKLNGEEGVRRRSAFSILRRSASFLRPLNQIPKTVNPRFFASVEVNPADPRMKNIVLHRRWNSIYNAPRPMS